jgi:hypothetical protein
MAYNRLAGALFLTVAGKEYGYWLDILPHEFGRSVRAYRLTKFVAQRKPGEPDHYDVTVDDAHGSCECKGFVFHGHCKHRDSLAALRRRGDLPGGAV